MEMNVNLIQEIEHLRNQVLSVGQGLNLDSKQHRTGLSDLADRLRSITENNVSRPADWRPDTANQFSFTAKILNTRVENLVLQSHAGTSIPPAGIIGFPWESCDEQGSTIALVQAESSIRMSHLVVRNLNPEARLILHGMRVTLACRGKRPF